MIYRKSESTMAPIAPHVDIFGSIDTGRSQHDDEGGRTTMNDVSRVVVVGGSLSGLMSGLLLARAGWDVAIVERDPLPVDGGPEDAWAAWPRPAVPQSGHSHNFLARIRAELAMHAPDVLARMHAAGIEDLHIRAHAPPAVAADLTPTVEDDLIALIGRRSSFEWALRRAVLEEPRVRAVLGDVIGLVADPGDQPRVTGVRLADGILDADLVVDASGRRSRAGTWLEAAGAPPLDFDSVDCGVTYFTRYYRLREAGSTWPTLTRGLGGGANFPTHMCAAFPADRRTYSVSLGVPPWVDGLGGLRAPAAFEALVDVSPASAPWGAAAAGEPITDVRILAGLRNGIRRRATVAPPALGLVLVGDAFMHTDPALARGVTIAVLSAARLAETVAEHRDEVDRATAWTAELALLADTYYDDVLDRDADRTELWRATWEGRSPLVRPVAEDVLFGDLARSMVTDAQVWLALQRAMNLLAAPSSAWAPDVVTRVRAIRDAGGLPPMPPVPTTGEVLAAAAS